MSTPTWGISIPGYSYPSAAQRKKFDRMYPGAAEYNRQERERDQREKDAARRAVVAEERKQQAACTHLFVPTNVDTNHVCRHCRMWVKSLAEVFSDLA